MSSTSFRTFVVVLALGSVAAPVFAQDVRAVMPTLPALTPTAGAEPESLMSAEAAIALEGRVLSLASSAASTDVATGDVREHDDRGRHRARGHRDHRAEREAARVEREARAAAARAEREAARAEREAARAERAARRDTRRGAAREVSCETRRAH